SRSAQTETGEPAAIEVTATITVGNSTGAPVDDIAFDHFRVDRVGEGSVLRLEQTRGLPVTNAADPGILESPTADAPPEPFALAGGASRSLRAAFPALIREDVRFRVRATGERPLNAVSGEAEATWAVAPGLCVRIAVRETRPVDGTPADP